MVRITPFVQLALGMLMSSLVIMGWSVGGDMEGEKHILVRKVFLDPKILTVYNNSLFMKKIYSPFDVVVYSYNSQYNL